MPDREDLRTFAFWTLIFCSPIWALIIVMFPPLLVPVILLFIGLLAWLRPRSE